MLPEWAVVIVIGAVIFAIGFFITRTWTAMRVLGLALEIIGGVIAIIGLLMLALTALLILPLVN